MKSPATFFGQRGRGRRIVITRWKTLQIHLHAEVCLAADALQVWAGGCEDGALLMRASGEI